MKKGFMKNLFLFGCFLHLAINCMAQATGFVRLEGKQFKDENGNNFFPIAMNYAGSILCDNASATNPSFKITRNWQYGTTNCLLEPTSRYDWANCELSLEDDFEKLNQMGFNTIRFLIQPVGNGSHTTPAGFYRTAEEFATNVVNGGKNGALCTSPRYTFQLGPTNYNTADAQTYFGLIAHALDLAHAHNIKVILLCADGAGFDNATQTWYHSMGSSAADAADYATYLSALASALKNKPALLAYDLYNEPNYNYYLNGRDMNVNKQTVCNYVKMWYDAIKNPNADPNHLVTIGGTNQGDVMSWDPSVMKIDFVSMHPYPFPDDVFKAHDQEKTEEVVNTIDWFGSELQMPWILGETGINSSDESCLYNYIWGNNTQQYNYLNAVLPAVRDCGGSGFSWWDFQNKHWYCIPDPVCDPTCNYCDNWGPGNPNSSNGGYCGVDFDTASSTYGQITSQSLKATTDAINGNYGGLLEYGDPIDPGNPNISAQYGSIDKPAVAIVQAFDPNAISTCSGPSANYYNPHHYLSSSGTIHGTVKDINGIPIKNAVIISHTAIHTTNSPPAGDISRNEFTYTDANGGFDLIPAPKPTTTNFVTTVQDLYISACGAERIFRSPATSYQNQTFYLDKTIISYDVLLSNPSISGNQIFSAWNSITVNTVTIPSGHTTDFTARSEVNAEAEFHAAQGSEVHLYTSDVFPDCSKYNNYSAEGRYGNGSAGTDSLKESSKNIEVYFKKSIANNSLSVIPNPSSGKFMVRLNSSDANSFIQHIVIYDIMGKEVYLSNDNIKLLNLDLSGYPKGIYFLKANDAYKNYNQKIILN
jgi:hypothetical protein